MNKVDTIKLIHSLLRIIEGAQNNDVEKVLKYSKPLFSDTDFSQAEKLIRERFAESPSIATLDKAIKVKPLEGDMQEFVDKNFWELI